MLYNALKVLGKLPEGASGKTLSDFTDAGRCRLLGERGHDGAGKGRNGLRQRRQALPDRHHHPRRNGAGTVQPAGEVKVAQ